MMNCMIYFNGDQISRHVKNTMKEHNELAQCTKGTKYLVSNSKDNLISSIVLYFGKEK